MKIRQIHSWDVDTKTARALQEELASRVVTNQPLKTWKTLAAADVSWNRHGKDLFAGVIVVDAETLTPIESVRVQLPVTFPYVPGLLSFREIPPLLKAFEQLKTRPDVVLCDGQGIAHPRRIGLASHLGLWLDMPTIGCAKSLLVGEYADLGPNRGDRAPLIDREDVVGAALRTRARVKPLFVSVGNGCDLDSAVAVVLSTIRRYRHPLPARLAHDYVNELRRSATKKAPQE